MISLRIAELADGISRRGNPGPHGPGCCPDQPLDELGCEHCLRGHCMAGLVPVPIVRIFEALRMRRVVSEEIRVEVDDLVTERRGLAAECLAHQIEIGTRSARRGIRIAEAVEGEQDPVRWQADDSRQVTKNSIDRGERSLDPHRIGLRVGVAGIARAGDGRRAKEERVDFSPRVGELKIEEDISRK